MREISTPASGESGTPDCGSAEATADPTADTDGDQTGDRTGGFATRLLARFHPPDICDDRPGLAKLSAYAYHGAGAPADGPLRELQIWWFRLVCRPITAHAYWKAWALERPLRGMAVLIVQLGWWLLNIATLVRLL